MSVTVKFLRTENGPDYHHPIRVAARRAIMEQFRGPAIASLEAKRVGFQAEMAELEAMYP